MSKSDQMKWVYTLILLFTTIGWAIFTVLVTLRAMSQPTPLNVLEVSGTGVMLGALITWCANVNQYWFRKKEPTKT